MGESVGSAPFAADMSFAALCVAPSLMATRGVTTRASFAPIGKRCSPVADDACDDERATRPRDTDVSAADDAERTLRDVRFVDVDVVFFVDVVLFFDDAFADAAATAVVREETLRRRARGAPPSTDERPFVPAPASVVRAASEDAARPRAERGFGVPSSEDDAPDDDDLTVRPAISRPCRRAPQAHAR